MRKDNKKVTAHCELLVCITNKKKNNCVKSTSLTTIIKLFCIHKPSLSEIRNNLISIEMKILQIRVEISESRLNWTNSRMETIKAFHQ